MNFDIDQIKTPYYIVDQTLLTRNLEILKSVAKEAGCKILLAQKAFSMFSLYPLIGQYLDGTAASGLYEAKLGKTEMGGETHVFAAAYRDDEFEELLKICDHIIFNSFGQYQKYRKKAVPGVSYGIRINPECSTQDHAIYDPCGPYSRLGVTAEHFREDLLNGISGLHFHTLCEQNSDDLISTVKAVEAKFGKYIKRMNWVNFGGGHHITKTDYNRKALIETIKSFKKKYGVAVYLEPGEAVALNTGFLVSTVLDIVENEKTIAILDSSAACHMPDVLEMPYRPEMIGADLPDKKQFTYRLGGCTCLAGDVIGDYSFDTPLEIGDRLVFCDMAIYSMVKNNTFNGMGLPSIAIADNDGKVKVVREFDYEDFKNRLS
jgi:carboxynorspermidine decarboxylase